jgi:nucleoid DNA-binding protein
MAAKKKSGKAKKMMKKTKTAHAKMERHITPLSSISPASKAPRTKSEVFSLLAETTGLSRRDVRSMFESLNDLIGKDLSKKGCGLFTVPGLLKIRSVHKPATPARKGINPFTGEETTFKAKPARNIVKIRPLKALKDMV